MDSTDSAMFVASVFGPFMAILGLWMLVSSESFIKVLTALRGSSVALYTSAIFSLLFGLLIINLFNDWTFDIYLFVTVLGWVLFFRGLIGLFMPQLAVKVQMTKVSWMKTQGIVPFVWGLILCWIAYYM